MWLILGYLFTTNRLWRCFQRCVFLYRWGNWLLRNLFNRGLSKLDALVKLWLVSGLVIFLRRLLLCGPLGRHRPRLLTKLAKYPVNIGLGLTNALPTAVIHPARPGVVCSQRLGHVAVVALKHLGHVAGLPIYGLNRVHRVNAILLRRGRHELGYSLSAHGRHRFRIKARLGKALRGQKVRVYPIPAASLFVHAPVQLRSLGKRTGWLSRNLLFSSDGFGLKLSYHLVNRFSCQYLFAGQVGRPRGHVGPSPHGDTNYHALAHGRANTFAQRLSKCGILPCLLLPTL